MRFRLLSFALLLISAARADSLPGTAPLTAQGDFAIQMVAGIDRFLLRETEESIVHRAAFWNRDLSSPVKYAESVAPNRLHLAKILGVVDAREKFDALELVGTVRQPALVGRGKRYEIYAVRWPVCGGIYGEGLLLTPTGKPPVADVIAIPDADQLPEMIAGLVLGVAPESQLARRLAENGCRVLVPTLVDRTDTFALPPSGHHTNESDREYVYSPAFEMGRHVIGYEVQKVLAGVDWFAAGTDGKIRPIGVIGHGEGGLIALYAAALDNRVQAACVSGYFDSRQNLWQEPIYRNVFRLLREFGDAEIASLILPRTLIVEACKAPEGGGSPPEHDGRVGGAPGRLMTPQLDSVHSEIRRAKEFVAGHADLDHIEIVVSGADGRGPFGTDPALSRFLGELHLGHELVASGAAPENLRNNFDPLPRLRRQIDQMQEFTQSVVRESEYTRRKFWTQTDDASTDRWTESVQKYRDHFANEVIGRFDRPLLPPNARTRQIYDEPKYVGYEVMLDVFPDVIAYGILLVPKDLKPAERRPVVVCQHGLEGRAQDVADPKVDSQYYRRFACQLADRGFITYAPQNPYIGGDRFRTLQRKANPLGKTLFSIIVPQHQQTLDWLATLPFVNPDRIAFYGLSYGGKTAMRVPALVKRYSLSICSGDFNEWIWKNTSLRYESAYPGTVEYEMFEWDLGNTFNYSNMAALIAPRPFMVERGYHDDVAPDAWVAYEYAKVRRIYANLKIPQRTEIEWFDGPHTIHGAGTFKFLHEQLKWPEPDAQKH